MSFIKSASPLRAILGVVAVGLIAGAGFFGASQVAQALNGGSDPAFIPHASACVSARDGSIRVLSPGQSCIFRERPILLATEEKVDYLTSSYVATADSGDATSANYADVSVSCDEGDQATGGGAWLDVGTPGNTNAGDNVALQASYPQYDGGDPSSYDTADGWRAFARELQNIPADISPSGSSHTPVQGYYGGQMTWGNFSGGEATYTSATGSSWTLHVYAICSANPQNPIQVAN